MGRFPKATPPEDGEVIYTPRIWHRYAKKYVYPKRSRVFRIVIRRKKR
jgi:hypothetical protein